MTQKNRFDDGKRFLQSLGFDNVSHSKRTLFHHLVATGMLLQDWGCCENTCLAGLVHAIYGTESFRYRTGLLDHREAVQNVIGAPAERIAWLFGICTGKSLWNQFSSLDTSANQHSQHALTHRTTAEDLPCDGSELLALANITFANAIDQAQHLPDRYDAAKLDTLRCLLPFIPPGGVEAFNLLSHQRRISMAIASP
jgi:hypothetical protein